MDGLPKSAREIFFDAIEKHPREDWPNFLKTACSGNTSLHDRVAKMLRAHGQSGSFMERPATAFLAEIFDLPADFETPVEIFPEIGRFRLIERIGSGGFGVVFLAEDPVLQRRVAIKIPRPETVSTADLQRRFVRESQMAAQLMHPHLVSIHEAGQSGLVSYQVTAFCAGGSLASWLRVHGSSPTVPIERLDARGPQQIDNSPQRQLPIEVAVELLIGLADGVHYAHERGILHRDLKPSNILLHPKWELSVKGSRTGRAFTLPESASDSPQESVKEDDSVVPGSIPLELLCKLFQPMISDFGLAKFYEEAEDAATLQSSGEALTPRHTTLMGTPEYMAPEQLDAQLGSIGPATDIYGLGAVLYEVLAGQPVYPHGSFETVRALVVRQPPSRLRQVRPEIPRDLEAICLKCLAKFPSQRYSSAKQLAEDLNSFLRNQPVTARSWSLHERLINWTRRRPAVAALSLFTGCLAVGLICFGLWHLYQLSVLNYKLVSTIQERELQTSVARHARSIAVDQAKIAQEQSDLANQQSYRSEELAWIAGQREYAANMWRAAEHHQHQQLSSMGAVLQNFLPPSEFLTNEVASIRRSEPLERTTRAGRVRFAVTFHQPVQGINLSHFRVMKNGSVEIGNMDVNDPADHRHYVVSVNGISGQGTLGLSVSSEAAGTDTGETYRISDFVGCEDSRGFEWYYLWNQGINLLDLKGHNEAIVDAALTPDGRVCFSVGRDGTVRRWDAKTARLLQTWSLGEPATHHLARISRDATRAIIARNLAERHIWEVMAWDLLLGKILQRFIIHEDEFGTIAIAPDGTWGVIASDSLDSAGTRRARARIWNFESGQFHPVESLDSLSLPESGTRAIAVSPDQHELAICIHTGPLNDQTRSHHRVLRVPLHGVDSGKWESAATPPKLGPCEVIKEWESGCDLSLVFSPTGQKLALSTIFPPRLEMWDWPNRRLIGAVPNLSEIGTGLSFDAKGESLAYGTYEKVSAKTNSHDASPTNAADSFRSVLMHWNPTKGNPQSSGYPAYQEVRTTRFHEPSSTWVIGESEGRLSLWRPEAPIPYHDLDGHRPTEAWGLTFAPDGKTLYTVGDDSCLRAWDMQTFDEISNSRQHQALVSCVAVSPDGRWIATGSYDDEVIIWNAESLSVHAILKGHTHDIRAVAFSPDGRLLASGGRDRVIRLWNIPDGTLKGTLDRQGGVIRAIGFTALNTIVEGNADGTIVVWQPSGSSEKVRAISSEVNCLALSPPDLIWPQSTAEGLPLSTPIVKSLAAGELVLYGSKFGTFKLMHVPSRQIWMERSHPGMSIRSVAFSPDGRTFGVAGDDKAIHLWHVASRQEILTFSDLPDSVNQIAFSPDGQILAAALHNGTVRLWFAPKIGDGQVQP